MCMLLSIIRHRKKGNPTHSDILTYSHKKRERERRTEKEGEAEPELHSVAFLSIINCLPCLFLPQDIRVCLAKRWREKEEREREKDSTKSRPTATEVATVVVATV